MECVESPGDFRIEVDHLKEAKRKVNQCKAKNVKCVFVVVIDAGFRIFAFDLFVFDAQG